MFLIAAVYEDADDCDSLHLDADVQAGRGTAARERECALLATDHVAAGALAPDTSSTPTV